MPKSRSRRKDDDYTPPERGELKDPTVSGRWVVPTMITLLLVGLVWIVVYYLVGDDIPLVQDLGGWNLLIGMGLITGGFMTATRWK
ncbi:cell division protein CrgA [Jiangella endophytica]|uniref:cell division protein CrgA n=1 Tax=Jiangella endophytica TaxID=1623398 RepID=UPI000E34EA27|nr:cell division protein CrgA [Jiangella endophytica]